MDNKPVGKLECRIRVLILSPYRIIQESLQILIEESRGMAVAGAFNLANMSIDADTFKSVETLVIYLTDESSDYIEAIPGFLSVAAHLRIVVVTAEKNSVDQMRAVELGAVGIVNKEQNSRILLEAIRQTNSGETWIRQSLLTVPRRNRNLKSAFCKNWDVVSASSLTVREKEVVQMIGRGLKNKEIANRLFIKESTVRHHLSAIFGKLGVADRLNLVIYAHRHKLIKDFVTDDKRQVF